MSAIADTAELSGPEEPPDRGVRYFLTGQTATSAGIAALGTASFFLLLVGSVVNLSVVGWTPDESVAEALTNTAQLAILIASLAAGGVAMLAGFGLFGRMPDRPSREGAIIGAVLGAQAVGLAALVLGFRAGDVPTFARNFFNFMLIGEFWERFLRGAKNTIVLALAGEGIGIGLGLLLSVLTVSKRRVVRAPARVYINFFRGTPLLWQLQFIFFGIILGLRLDLTTYQTAILVLGLNAGAYTAEIFRSGIEGVDRGQLEAARSLGMSHLQALRLVVLPQAVRRVIPPLTNEFVILIKDTSLVAFLGVTFAEQELLAVGRDIYSATFDATAYVGTAAGYLAITLPMIRFVTWLEKRLRSGHVGIGA